MLKPTLIAGAIFICAYLLGNSYGYSPWRSPAQNALDFRVVSSQGATVATMTSDRRSIIIVPDARNGANADLRICPEPPADAADNVAALFSASAGGEAAGPSGPNKGNAALSSGTTQALASIFERSQGIELFRDGSNALCLAWLNDIYNQGDVSAWRSDFRLLLRTSSALIAQEIESDRFNQQQSALPPAPVIPFPLPPQSLLPAADPEPSALNNSKAPPVAEAPVNENNNVLPVTPPTSTAP